MRRPDEAHRFCIPVVVEVPLGGEPFEVDDFGLFPGEDVKEKEAETPKSTSPPDYTKQLEFHQYELSQAGGRGFPPGQVAYHLGKIARLQGES